MAILSALVLLHISTTVLAAFCKKEFFYHQHYSYGYDIYCSDLDKQTISELTETVVYNEIKLTIEYSSFQNTSWHVAKHLPKLREINLIYCQLDNPNIFNELHKLTSLNIQHSLFDRMNYHYFEGLDSLQNLILKNNSLPNIILNDFHNLDALVLLNLNNNYLRDTLNINNCTFYNLKEIYLQHNYIKELGNISCLRYVEELYLDFNSITNIDYLDALLNLRILSLNHNSIEKFKMVQDFNKLEVLNLEGNKLSVLDEGALHNLKNLKNLNLKDNGIYIILDVFFANVNNLTHLNLNDNNIDRIDLKYLPHIQELRLHNNRISSLKTFSASATLRKLDVSTNSIREIEQYVFSKLFNLTSLNLSNNFIENNIYDASFFGLTNLEELHMQNTSTSYIPEDIFIFSTKLEVLNLSSNKMKEFGTLFEKLSNLRTLNISFNRLEELRYTTIKNLINLEIIDVEGNSLKNVEYESIVMYLHRLATINIKNNTLTCEFLTRMINFFMNNHVNYTINEDFNYDKENVAGIYCKETKNKLNDTLRRTSTMLEDNAVLLKQLVNLTKNTTNEYNKTLFHSVTYATISVILISALLIFGIYRVYMYLKRRQYCSDEFELIGRDKY